jgi:hypothetical protein
MNADVRLKSSARDVVQFGIGQFSHALLLRLWGRHLPRSALRVRSLLVHRGVPPFFGSISDYRSHIGTAAGSPAYSLTRP